MGKGGRHSSLILLLKTKNNLLNLSAGPGLRLKFHWYVHLFILTKSLFSSVIEVFTLCTTENNIKVSSANNLAFGDRTLLVTSLGES